MALDTTKTAHEIITSGRSTGQTVIDSDGNLKWAIENRTQTDLDNAAEWTLNNLLSSVKTGVNANGNKNYLLTEDTTTASHYISRLVSVTSGETYTISTVVKSNGRDAAIALGGAFGADVWAFDLTTLSTIRLSGTSITSTATATALTNGEVLIEVTSTAILSGNYSVLPHLWDGGPDTDYDGDGISGLYVSEVKVYQSAIKGRAQLITNGTFSSDVSGWSSDNGLLTWNAAGYADFDRNGEPYGNHLYQSISTTVGKTYRVAYEIVAVSNTVDLSIPGQASIIKIASIGQKFHTFVATSTTTVIQFNAADSVTATFSIDNISVLEMTDAMQRDKYGSNFLENETGAALYGLGIDYSTGRGGLQVYEDRTNLLLNTASLSTQSVTVTATPYTLSFTGAGTVTLSGASTAGPLFGTGAADTDRVSLTFTPSAGTLTLTVSGSVTFAQLEAGSSTSPYIPTYGSSVTRGDDDLSTLISSFGYNVNAGTVVADFVTPGSDGADFPRAWVLATSANDDAYASVFTTRTNYLEFRVVDGSVFQASLDLGEVVPNTQIKVAASFATDDFAASRDGGAVVVDTSGNLPTSLIQLLYGRSVSGAHLNGLIYSLAYYPFAASDAQLVEASS